MQRRIVIRAVPGGSRASEKGLDVSFAPEGTRYSWVAEDRPDQGDVAGARPDGGVADEQVTAHMTLTVGEAMRPAVGAAHADVGQGARVPAIGLHLPRARGVHGGEVWVGDDDLVPQRLEASPDPFAVGRGLDHDPRPGRPPSTAVKRSGSVRIRCSISSPPSPRIQDLALPLVDVDVNMVQDWPVLSAALTAGGLLWGHVGHHVKREASRFVPSTRALRRVQGGTGT